MDDEPRNWDFSHFDRVVSEMHSGSTSVGSILGAMVYQIEKQNAGEPAASDRQQADGPATPKDPQEDAALRESLMSEMDQIVQKIAVESAVVETDFKHVFEGKKVGSKHAFNENSSPYQQLLTEADSVHIRSDKYKFLNGKSQAHYEDALLSNLQLPGINRRFQMPDAPSRDVAERKADTALILRNCRGLPSNQAHRMLLLKEFQDLLKQNNPERTYNFMDRNY